MRLHAQAARPYLCSAADRSGPSREPLRRPPSRAGSQSTVRRGAAARQVDADARHGQGWRVRCRTISCAARGERLVSAWRDFGASRAAGPADEQPRRPSKCAAPFATMEDRGMDVHQFPDAGPGSPGNGGPRAPVVMGSGIVRRYGRGDTAVDALRGVSVEIAQGRLTAVMGPSGSGKSTLMHILAGLDRPTSGEVSIAGVEITALDDTQLTKLRRDHIGFIFSSFNLLP